MSADQNLITYQSCTDHPLFSTADLGHLAELKEQVKQWPQPLSNTRDLDGWTILHFAVWKGNVEATEWLLCNCPTLDLDILSIRGNSALLLAIEGGFVDIARLLLKHGADTIPKTDLKRTPLQIAVQTYKSTFVLLLLEYGAKTDYDLFGTNFTKAITGTTTKTEPLSGRSQEGVQIEEILSNWRDRNSEVETLRDAAANRRELSYLSMLPKEILEFLCVNLRKSALVVPLKH